MTATTNPTTTATPGAAALQFSVRVVRNIRGELEAETLHHLEALPGKALFIRTGKTSGGVASSWTVKTQNGHFWCWEMLGDFSERKAHKGARATEKTIKELQAQALQEVPAMLERIAAHYAKKAATH